MRPKERFRAAGAELKAFYLITGEYDAVAISEAPNDEVVVKLAMTTAAQEHMDTDVPRVHRGRILEDGDVFVVATNLRNCTSQIQFCAGPGTLKSARAQPLKVSLR